MKSDRQLTGDEEFQGWPVETQLAVLRPNEARFSLGFLQAEPISYFPTIGKYWVELLHAIGVDVGVTGTQTSLDFPENLFRVTPIEVEGEICVLGFDEQSFRAIVDGISPGCQGRAADLVFEYVERRLVATMAKAWAGASAIQCYYLPLSATDAVEIVASIALLLDLGGVAAAVYLGVGPRFTERLDMLWRGDNLAEHFTRDSAGVGGDPKRISVVIAELDVPPAMLIDYLRPGAVIDLEQTAHPAVSLRINGEPWARGELCQLNGKFAAKIQTLHSVAEALAPGTTRVLIEMAHADLDDEAIFEHSRVGAVLVTNVEASSRASIVLGGEHVGVGDLGEIDGGFALHVLPK